MTYMDRHRQSAARAAEHVTTDRRPSPDVTEALTIRDVSTPTDAQRDAAARVVAEQPDAALLADILGLTLTLKEN